MNIAPLHNHKAEMRLLFVYHTIFPKSWRIKFIVIVYEISGRLFGEDYQTVKNTKNFLAFVWAFVEKCLKYSEKTH